MPPLYVRNVDISHARLVELTKLADQAKPFYEWVEQRFQQYLSSSLTLDELLMTVQVEQMKEAILYCYAAEGSDSLPLLFNGIGRSYPHSKACYYFFAWIIRDAPQQRLGPLIAKISRNSTKGRIESEAEALAVLIAQYRGNVKTFSWAAVREVIIDRLEGSRRSIKGHEKETIVRTALLTAIQTYFDAYNSYGLYANVELDDKEVMIGNETFDVSGRLILADGSTRRILAPIKTRETEGGGHSHLFTRDIKSAMNTLRLHSPLDYLFVVIVAQNWSERETEDIMAIADHAAVFNLSPNDFTEFSLGEQSRLNHFIANVLSGFVVPKSAEGLSSRDDF